MMELPAVADLQFGCFTLGQARCSGWSPDALERAVRGGRLLRPRSGVYRGADSPGTVWDRRRTEHAVQSVAAVLATPGTRVSGVASAILHGLAVLSVPPVACVSAERWVTGDVRRAHLHRCAASETLMSGSVQRDGVTRTVTDVAREHGITAGVVVLDHALHLGATTMAEVHAELARIRGWPGSRRAQAAAEAADGMSESALESRSRLAIAAAGLPEPTSQARIGNDWGGFVARVDFYWDEHGVVGEVDGAVKYDGTDPTPLLEEKRRQERLENLGLQVVRWDSGGVARFDATADRLRRAFARGCRARTNDRNWTLLPRLALITRDSGQEMRG